MSRQIGERGSLVASTAATLIVIGMFLMSALSVQAAGPFCGGPFQPPCPPITFPQCGVPGLPACPCGGLGTSSPPCGPAQYIPPYEPPLSGPVSDTYYDTTAGDNVLRLINPIGTGTTNMCAMIYVFDSNENMLSCCGCPLSPQKLLSLSVENNLTHNGVRSVVSGQVATVGIIDIISILPDAPLPSNPLHNDGLSNGQGCPITQTKACNSGCDPTGDVYPYDYAYYDQVQNEAIGTQYTELKGYIVHNAVLPGYLDTLPELPLANTGWDPTATTYLMAECGAIVGSGNGAGVCSCGS